jgi:hypothetical protein
MHANGLKFSISAHAAWAPGIVTAAQWNEWAAAPYRIGAGADPALRAMPAMLRRRAGFLGKMALEVAYACLDGRTGVPTVFCSRHGEVTRAVELLGELAQGQALSPTAFGLAVHNASAGLFSIARADHANHIALAGAGATIEHGVVEACGLLADGAPQVLLVAYDAPLPALLSGFEDCDEQPYAWAWLMTAAERDVLCLSLEPAEAGSVPADPHAMPAGLDLLRFQLSGAARHARTTGAQRWSWTRDA